MVHLVVVEGPEFYLAIVATAYYYLLALKLEHLDVFHRSIVSSYLVALVRVEVPEKDLVRGCSHKYAHLALSKPDRENRSLELLEELILLINWILAFLDVILRILNLVSYAIAIPAPCHKHADLVNLWTRDLRRDINAGDSISKIMPLNLIKILMLLLLAHSRRETSSKSTFRLTESALGR